MAEHQKPLVLQQQPKILEWKWEKITMDFVTKFPKSVLCSDKSLDTAYPPVVCDVSTLLPEQRIEFYSLNNVYVLPNNTSYSLNSIQYTGTQQIHTAYSNQLDTAYMSSDTEIVDKETTMAEPNDYITATQKNFVSNDNVGRMVEKSIVEIQGTFFVKIRNNAFNGNIGENAFKHIDKFLEVVEAIKINGLTQDRFRLSVFPVSLAGATNLFTFKIQGTKAYEEYESNISLWTGVPEENHWSENRNYEASNAGDTQDNQGHKERRDNPTHEPSVYKVRRFEMMKYSFNADEEYIAIKESDKEVLKGKIIQMNCDGEDGEVIPRWNRCRPPYYAKKGFTDHYLPCKWEIAKDAELNPFKDVLVFRRMAPKDGDGAWNIRIELIDPDEENFKKTFQSIPTSRKLSAKENPVPGDGVRIKHDGVTFDEKKPWSA
ncbi:hypothetical protein Tco_0656968 [Tanacetum coccineum]|uniref:Uncharacterized protein n=1 Tax=Tanacetum coccineum TaxID=301880 RepID=A0ABQ4XA86_9ASTR